MDFDLDDPSDGPETLGWANTAPFGLLRFAEDYRCAAEVVVAEDPRYRIAGPAWTLMGQSIELSFKAWLLSQWRDMARIRKLGHDLEAGMSASVDSGLNSLIGLEPGDHRAVVVLNQTYSKHRHRYMETGEIELPPWDRVSGFALRLTRGLHDSCGLASAGLAWEQFKMARGGWVYVRGEPRVPPGR